MAPRASSSGAESESSSRASLRTSRACSTSPVFSSRQAFSSAVTLARSGSTSSQRPKRWPTTRLFESAGVGPESSTERSSSVSEGDRQPATNATPKAQTNRPGSRKLIPPFPMEATLPA